MCDSLKPHKSVKKNSKGPIRIHWLESNQEVILGFIQIWGETKRVTLNQGWCVKKCRMLHMQLEPWVPPCVLFGWWFSPWELWKYWLVHIFVPPMRLQTPSDPWVLFLAPPLGTLCSDQRLAESIYLCICQALAEPLRRQLY